MKKIISLILMIAMLISVSAFAEEDFTLHNGLKFGMSKEEVYETEKTAGVELTEGEFWDYEWNGTIAGEMNSKLCLYFWDDDTGLTKVIYEFNTLGSYDTLNNGLIEKYGETPYSSKTGVYLDEPTTNHVDNLGFAIDTYSNADYSQWLIPYSDTQSVYIEHYVFQRERVSYTEVFESFSRVEHVISYELLDEYTTEQYRNPYSGDL